MPGAIDGCPYDTQNAGCCEHCAHDTELCNYPPRQIQLDPSYEDVPGGLPANFVEVLLAGLFGMPLDGPAQFFTEEELAELRRAG